MQYTPGGTAVTKLRLATDRYRKDAENETDWHNIVVWSNTAEAVNQYVAKGDSASTSPAASSTTAGRATTASAATAPRSTPPRSCSSTPPTATAAPGRPLTPRPSSSPPPYSRTATPSRRRDAHGAASTLQGSALLSVSDQYRRKVTAMSITMWLALGERGISSEAIALTALRVHPIGHDASWPHDPGDLRRCLLLLEEAPETRENGLLVLAKRCPKWAALGERLGPPVGDIALRNRRDPPARRLSAQDVGIDEGGVGLGRQGLSDSSGRPRDPQPHSDARADGRNTTGPLPTYRGGPAFVL